MAQGYCHNCGNTVEYPTCADCAVLSKAEIYYARLVAALRDCVNQMETDVVGADELYCGAYAGAENLLTEIGEKP